MGDAASAWHGDSFCSALTLRLTDTLTGARVGAALAAAVAEAAATAEAVCTGREMACSAGCPHCCVLNVAVLLPEAMRIAQWKSERLGPAELAVLQKELRVHRSWTRWMEDDERIAKQMTCPLLDERGSCTIHPVRPLSCRGVSSLDSARCGVALAPGTTDEVRSVPTDLLRRAAYDEAFTALGGALKQHGFDYRSIELGTGVLAFLEGSECRELLLDGGRLPGELWR